MTTLYLIGKKGKEVNESMALDDFCRRKLDEQNVAILAWSSHALAEAFLQSIPGDISCVVPCKQSLLFAVMKKRYKGSTVELDVPPIKRRV